MAAPQLTPEQRAAALVKAAEARRARAEIKSLLKDGSITFEELVDRTQSDPMVSGMKVKAVLAALPGLGKVKAYRLMEEIGIAENRRLRGLGSRQWAALRDSLG